MATTDPSDHDFIVERLEEYIKAYTDGDADALLGFFHPEDFGYSGFGESAYRFASVEMPAY